jgi:hypothetical protein
MSYLPGNEPSILNDITKSLSAGVNTINDEIGKAAETVKKTATDAVSSVTGNQQPQGLYGTPAAPSGGKKKRSRGKRGGYSANTPLNNIASSASPYKGVETAQPHNWVGGKSKRGGRRRKTRRTRRNRRSRRMRR